VTTIAYRDGVLAADTLSTANGLRDDYGAKVWKHKGVLGAGGGITGDLSEISRMGSRRYAGGMPVRALEMGATAEQAVAAAMKFDTGTGGEVQSVRLD